MSKVYDLVFQIAAQLDGQFGSAMSTVAKDVSALSVETKKYNRQLEEITHLQNAKKELEELRKKYYTQKKAVAETDAMLKRHKASNSTFNAVMKVEEAELERVSAAMNRQKASVEALTGKLRLSSYATAEITKQQEVLQKAVEKTEKKLRSQQKTLEFNGKIADARNELRNAQVGMTTSIMNMQSAATTVKNIITEPLKAAMSMEDTMAEIRKVVDFKEPNGLKKMQQDLEEMSLRIPLSVKGLGEITAAAGQAGIAEEDLLSFTESAAKMGVAFDITAAEAGDMMAKWRSGMALTQAQAVELADATNALSNKNAALGRQIGEALKRYGALGKVAGLTEKQVAALAATVIGAGAEAEVAATGMNAMMRALTKGGSMSDKQKAAYINIGFDPKQLQKDVKEDAPKAIMSVLEAIKVKVPAHMQNQYLSAMFGEEGARALGPLLANTAALQKNFAMIADKTNYADSMEAEFQARLGTLSNAFQLMSNTMDIVKARVGESLIEPFKDISAVLLEVGKTVAGWIKQNSALVKQMIYVAAGVGAAVTALMGLRVVFLSAYTAVQACKLAWFTFSKVIFIANNALGIGAAIAKAYSVVMTGLPLVMSKAAAMAKVLGVALKAIAFNPLTIAITAAVAAGVLIYKNWDTIKQKAEELWKAFQERFPGLASFVEQAYESIRPVVDNVKGVFSGIIDFVTGVFSGDWQKAWDGIVKAFSSTFALISQFVKSPLNAVISMVNTCIRGINKMASFELPFMGGKSVGINIPEIPALATGGVVKAPTLAMVGEGKEPEAILPISSLMKLMDRMGAGDQISQIPPVVVNVSEAQSQVVKDGGGRIAELADSFGKMLSKLNEKLTPRDVPLQAEMLGRASEQPSLLATLSDLIAGKNASNTINQSAPVTVNMNINVDAASGEEGVKQAVTRAAKSAAKSLRQELEQLRMNELRLSYR